MRIPLPERIKLFPAAAVATVVFLAQVLEGTDVAFAGLFWLYMIASVFAFNACGGLAYPSGSYVFFNALLTCVVGLVYKIILVEPGNSNLLVPRVTMTAYLLGMVMTGFVGSLNRRLAPRRGLLANLGDAKSYKDAALGAFVVGAIFDIATYGSTQGGTFVSALRQINSLSILAVVLATFAVVKESNGKRSANWIVVLAAAYTTFLGIISTSKQGLATGAVAWLVTAVVAGHNFTRRQIVGIVLGAFFYTSFLAPFSQVARNTKGETRSVKGDWANALSYLADIGKTRSDYLAQQETINQTIDANDTANAHFFNEPQGLFDRLNMLAPDDALASITEDGTVEGLYPTYFGFINLVPRFIWRDKPTIPFGNIYAHEMGGLSNEDDSTGISFSPTGDAFHQDEYWGVFIVVPLVVFLLFFTTDSLSGDIRVAPWGILFVVLNSHNAPEGMIGGQIYEATYNCAGVAMVAIVTGYVLPILTRVFTNRDRTRVNRFVDFKPIQPRSNNI